MKETLAGAWKKGGFADDVSQLASKSTLREISASGNAAGGGWTFSEPDICTRAAALSYMAGALSIVAGNGRGAHDFLSAPALRLARLWEDLWKLGGKTPRGYALLNAACAYELAGYQASAACLSRVFERERGREGADRAEPDMQDLASMFLQRRFVALRGACARLAAEPDYGAVDNIEYRLGAAAAASALSRLASFFLSGAADGIGAAAADLSTAGRVFYQYGYHRESALLHSLRALAAPMSSRSAWSILGDRARSQFAWNRYLLLLGRGLGAPVPECRSAPEVWPSQRNAVDGGLLESDASKIVRMPTSSGRMRIAEMAMLKALTSGTGAAFPRCVYVAPHNAMVSEAAEAISAVFADLGFSVSGVDGAYDGGLSDEGGAASRGDIMVMAPEKLDLLLRAHRDRLEGVGLFIFDKCHIICDGPRGMKLEILLTRLKRRFRRARFMLLSAAISTEAMREFSEWLSGSGGNVIETEWMPTRLRRARFEWSRIGSGESGGECTLAFDREGEDGRPIRVDAAIKRRQYRHYNQAAGRIARPSFPSAEKGETAAELAFKYSGMGPVMVYAATKESALSAAKKLAYRLELTARAGEEVPSKFSRPAGAAPPRSQALSSEWLGPDHEVSRLLGRGIAVHTEDMPDGLRRAVEEDMRRGRYAVIAATGTLSQGASMPVRTVIIHSCRRYDPDAGTERRMPDHEYWDLAGRAGRPGHETEGTVVHIVKTAADREDYDHYGERRKCGAIRSRICGMLLDLVQGRISDGTVEAAVDPEVLGMLAEEGARGSCEDVIGGVVSGSLGALQALSGAGAGVDAGAGLERLRGRFLAVAGRAARLDGGAALAYGRTGMSTQSCDTLSSHVDGSRKEVARLLSAGGDGDAADLVLLALDAIDGLPEMRGGGEQYGGDREALVRLWMGGCGASEACRGVEPADRSAAMSFMERHLGRTAPWGISAFVRIAACRAGIAEADLPAAVRHLPDMVRYGVPSGEAAWAMRLGVTTRRAAMGVAEGCPSGLSFDGFAEWLAGLGDDDLAGMCGPDAPLAEIAAALSRMRPNPLIREERGLDEVLAMRPSVACAGAAGRRAAASCSAGDPLDARRDHDAAADRNAIAVHSAGGLIGPMERDVAQYLAPLIDCGMLRLGASFDGPDGGAEGTASVRIRLRRADKRQ